MRSPVVRLVVASVLISLLPTTASAQSIDQLVREAAAYLDRDSCESARSVLEEIPTVERDAHAHLLAARIGRCVGDLKMTIDGLHAFDTADGHDPVAGELRRWVESGMAGWQAEFEAALEAEHCGSAGTVLRRLEGASGAVSVLDRGLIARCRDDIKTVEGILENIDHTQLEDQRARTLRAFVTESKRTALAEFEAHLADGRCQAADSALRHLEEVSGHVSPVRQARVAQCRNDAKTVSETQAGLRAEFGARIAAGKCANAESALWMLEDASGQTSGLDRGLLARCRGDWKAVETLLSPDEPPAQGDLQVDPFADEVAQVVEDLLSLPGAEIRRTYLAQVEAGVVLALEGTPAKLAARLRAAGELLKRLELTTPSKARLEALLRGALAVDPAVREASLHAAATGGPAPEVPATAAPVVDDPEEVEAPGLLDDLSYGVGGIEWGLSVLRLRSRLGADAVVTSAGGWSVPTYPEDLGVVTVRRDVLGCPGEQSFIVTSEGLARVWFTSEDPACWTTLSDAVQEALGPSPAEERFTPAGGMLDREWTTPGRITLAVGVQDGEPKGPVYLHIQPPEGLLEAGVPVAVPTGSYRGGSEGSEVEESRATRGRRMKGRASAHLGAGFGLLAASVGTGAAALGVFFNGCPGTDSCSNLFGPLAVTGVTLGTISAVFLVVGASMDIHANILISRHGGPGPDVRLAVGFGRGAIVVKF
jgi:hypothetical protein